MVVFLAIDSFKPTEEVLIFIIKSIYLSRRSFTLAICEKLDERKYFDVCSVCSFVLEFLEAYFLPVSVIQVGSKDEARELFEKCVSQYKSDLQELFEILGVIKPDVEKNSHFIDLEKSSFVEASNLEALFPKFRRIAEKIISGPIYTSTEIPQKPKRKFRKAMFAGTFDRLHLGHKFIVWVCIHYLKSEEVVFGVTSDELAWKKKNPIIIEPFCQRQRNLINFVELAIKTPAIEDTFSGNTYFIGEDVKVSTIQIDDAFAPASTDPNVGVLVVTPDVRKGGDLINKIRVENGLQELKIIEMPEIQSISEEKFSSSIIQNYSNLEEYELEKIFQSFCNDFQTLGISKKTEQNVWYKMIQKRHFAPDLSPRKAFQMIKILKSQPEFKDLSTIQRIKEQVKCWAWNAYSVPGQNYSWESAENIFLKKIV
eukprot:GHVP01011152.1.p1 GENE.GHVP01011152.1~~GHVP01011152.1.p1  ORF type:complete len:426 (+),score=79.74 GHVP01011152.1:1094-2371(+)